MKRVVVTGMGIVSCLGNDKASVLNSLREGKSGIRLKQEYVDLGLRSHIAGSINIDIEGAIDRRDRRFMSDAAAYAYIAMQQAIDDAELPAQLVSNERCGLIAGSGGPSLSNVVEVADVLRAKGVKRLGPYRVPKSMSSTVSACLATPFKIKGVNYSITSACSTSAHCIGNAMELIQMGKQDIVFAGGGEEEHWTFTAQFDAMGALSTKYNDTPEKASRAYDIDRDGFVIAGGGAMLVVEEREHAIKRGAKIYAEITGYGATSDGFDMVSPSGEGAVRCMRQAMSTSTQPVEYINAHGTSTPVGDIKELNAVKEVFADNIPLISSTKSLSGHSLGAAGAHEAIYSLLMMEHNFIAASANVENIDPEAEGVPIVTQMLDQTRINTMMSNSFGFGGTNASLLFERHDN